MLNMCNKLLLSNFSKTYALITRSCTAHLPIENINSEIDLYEFQSLFESEEKKNTIMELLNEYNISKSQGRNVPSHLNLEMMKELLLLESKSQRWKYLTFKFKKEKSQLHKKMKRMQEANQKLVNIANSDSASPSNHIDYNLGKNCNLIRLTSASVRKWHNLRQANATLFGQNIVFDLNYEEFMMRKEVQNCACQLTMAFGDNIMTKNPYNIYICNAKTSSYSVECLQKRYSFDRVDNFVNCTEMHYLDLFPKEKLVYLSPHAENKITQYDHDAIYIIGAFVDLSKKYKLSNQTADREGIKSYALPLDDYVMWSCGSKSLSINQVFRIMLEMKNTNDWRKALKFVPARKIKKIVKNINNEKKMPVKLFNPCTESNKAME